MSLRKLVRRILFFVVWCALIQASLVAIDAVFGSDKVSLVGSWVSATIVAFLVTFAGWYEINRRVGTELMDGDERDYVNAAWLCGLFGVLLMIIEAIFEFERLQHFKIEFIFEDFLLGASALCMLAEEVRLLKAAVNAANVLEVGPGFDRIVVPPQEEEK